jgi:hypothetical protein
MKYVEPCPYTKPEAAAARLFEIAKAIGADRRGLVSIGAWNATFLNRDKANAAEYALGRDHLIASGLIEMDGRNERRAQVSGRIARTALRAHVSGGFIMWKGGPPT